MQYNSVGIIQVLLYLAIPLGYLLDWIFIGRDFEALELAGAGIICVINILITSLRLCGYIE